MIKLLKYLKGNTGIIIVIVAMLFLQAYCDLSLPGYTSDIVNIGIQQSGIDTVIPKSISKESLDSLFNFMSAEDKEVVLSYYDLDKKDVYQLNTEDEDKLVKIEKTMKDPMLVIYSLTSEESKDKVAAQLGLPEGTDVLAAISAMDDTMKANMIAGITEELDKFPDMIRDQMITAYIKAEYTNVNIDLDDLQFDYIMGKGFMMIAIAGLGMLAAIFVVIFSSRLAAQFSKRVREDVFKKVISFSNTEFDKFSTASLITRSTNDVQQIQMLMMMVFRIVIYAPILGVGGIFKAMRTDSNMTWIIGLAVAVILSIMTTMFLLVIPKFKKLQSIVDRLNLVMREILTGISVIRAFGTSKHEEERFDDVNNTFRKTNLFVNTAMVFMMPIMMFVMNGITILIVYKGAYGIDDGNLQVGDMMAFIQYAMQIIIAFLMISIVAVIVPRAAVSGNRIGEVLSTKATIVDPKVSKIEEDNKKGEVVFNHVSFKYADAEEDVLSDINFTALKGQTTAIIGSTGSGKSTLVNLIPRFFDVTEGSVTINGLDIRDITQDELRCKIGYVPQKSVLFSGTIDSNIKFGKEDATKEEAEKAATIAQAMDFINGKEKGFDADISQGGSNVSGGQKQRLSIARAIVRKPEIYIFDDSFSALDFKTDVVLRRALSKEIDDSIIFIVAQRISTIMHAEQIIVLDEGKVVGIGTHSKLLKDCEVYQQIASSQLSEKELLASTKEVAKHE